MSKPNANERTLAKKTIALLKRAANVSEDLNLYLLAREVDEPYQANGRSARRAIALAIGELNQLLGETAEVEGEANGRVQTE